MYIRHPYPSRIPCGNEWRLYIIHLGAFTVALFLTNCFEVAKFLHRQNQSVQVNAFYVYAHPRLAVRRQSRHGRTLQIYDFIFVSQGNSRKKITFFVQRIDFWRILSLRPAHGTFCKRDIAPPASKPSKPGRWPRGLSRKGRLISTGHRVCLYGKEASRLS